MNNTFFNTPTPANEPVLTYAPGTAERELLQAELRRQMQHEAEVPLIIGGQSVSTGNMGRSICPHNHQHVLARYQKAGSGEAESAISAALSAKPAWEAMHWSDRAAIFLRAADLISTTYRYTLNAATMLNQGKNAFQAEIDAACELADFLRFNVHFMQQIYGVQPAINSPGIWNQLDYRPLEGFVFAVSPFNFTAIAGNLATAPAVMGNTVVWKPASTAVLSGYYLMQVFKEAGLPDGVINFVPGSGGEVGDPVLANPHLAGVHFTGSTHVFNDIWQRIGGNIDAYRSYPRIVGETGGKDFIMVHDSADPESVITAAIRGAFEYQGQKCSAASRMYVPRTFWNSIRDRFIDAVGSIPMGDVTDFSNFMNAVIDEKAFRTITGFIDRAKASDKAQIVTGGGSDATRGFFIEPTVILTTDPHFITMEAEIFGPVLTVYVYDDGDYGKTLQLCDETSGYALTGAVFAGDRHAVAKARSVLRNAAGNFYVNDKPTGAVVGQQPFGGSRKSGTNDKAGSHLNLLRWTSPRTIKESFSAPTDYRYPSMG
ncbi:MAG: L-glutamate gamma-semialdehyde dehydrogenase [Desulfobacteraceae bacterium]|nr:L-glutamate gamma-semialdehyde dehydrogenase [Desulfobacteraceae bacterium]